MSNGNDPTGGMGKLSRKTREKVDKELEETEIALLRNTSVDLESLRPKVSDGESFDKLIDTVKTATARNESLAELKRRITDLGEGVVKVAKEVFDIIKKI